MPEKTGYYQGDTLFSIDLGALFWTGEMRRYQYFHGENEVAQALRVR
jgi:hypothetical protein